MFDIRKITDDDHDSIDVLRDSKGNYYEISDEYYLKFLRQTQSRNIKLAAARYLIGSKLKILTDRQKEVLIKRMGGQTLRSISKDLRLDVSTVKEHLNSAIRKLKKLIKRTEGVILDDQYNNS